MQNPELTRFIPCTQEEVQARGWKEIDVLLVSGDAYIDHPSFGIAVIGRVLLEKGYRVVMLPQPAFPNREPGLSKKKCLAEWRQFGTPKLFVGISSGVVDSMVNNYTANKRFRSNDDYSPGGEGGKRPDRAATVFAEIARSAFPNTVIVGGGVECSFRRLSHYDYWENKLMPSLLDQSEFDYLVYGMGEKTILELAELLKRDEAPLKDKAKIRGIAFQIDKQEVQTIEPRKTLPSFREVKKEKRAFLRFMKNVMGESNPYCSKMLIQEQLESFVLQTMPCEPLSTEEFDRISELPFTKEPHFMYRESIPALSIIKHSVIATRGCFGGCTFCALALQQGKFVQSRSIESIKKECEAFKNDQSFKGTITDIGGPTANSYNIRGKDFEKCKNCKRVSCLFPNICNNLNTSHKDYIKLLKGVRNFDHVKHLYVASGVRFDLALKDKEFIKELVTHYVGGHLKVAPEHVDDHVLKLMGKPEFKNFDEFQRIFEEESAKAGKEQYMVPYFISSFPGCGMKEMEKVRSWLGKQGWKLQQVQDFIPLPMTVASVMYYTGMDMNGDSIRVAKSIDERKRQRSSLHGGSRPQFSKKLFHKKRNK